MVVQIPSGFVLIEPMRFALAPKERTTEKCGIMWVQSKSEGKNEARADGDGGSGRFYAAKAS